MLKRLYHAVRAPSRSFFFFNETAPTEIYPLSLHDALPIFLAVALPRIAREMGTTANTLTWVITGPLLVFGVAAPAMGRAGDVWGHRRVYLAGRGMAADRKSTRLNSSHLGISYAVFCLTKKHQRFSRFRQLLPRRSNPHRQFRRRLVHQKSQSETMRPNY